MTPKSPPGVLLYREVYVCIQHLPDEDAGQLVRALFEYAFDGVVPQLPTHLALVWALLQPALDRDRERYEDRVRKAAYAADSRERKRKGLPRLSYVEWCGAFSLAISADTD